MAMFPTVVLAHHPTASDSCDGLSVDMTSYPGPGTPNRLTVTIDKTVVLDTAFGETFSQWFPWSQTADHNWGVVVDGATPDGDATLSGLEYACQAEDTQPPSTEAPTTTAAATTTSTTEATIALVSPASVDTTTTVAPETTTTVQVASLAPAAPPSAVAAVSGAAPSADVLPATGTRSVAPMVLLGSFLIVG